MHREWMWQKMGLPSNAMKKIVEHCASKGMFLTYVAAKHFYDEAIHEKEITEEKIDHSAWPYAKKYIPYLSGQSEWAVNINV